MKTKHNSEQDAHFMQQAIELAKLAATHDEVPIGAVIVNSDNVVIARSHNQKEKHNDPCMHAEIVALQQAAKHLSNWRLVGCRMYVTLEPCMMCAGALHQARIDHVNYACKDPKAGALGSLYEVHNDERLNHQFAVTSGVMAEESSALLKGFFKKEEIDTAGEYHSLTARSDAISDSTLVRPPSDFKVAT